MQNLIAPWKHWLHWQTLLIGALFGMVGSVTLWADMRIPLVPQLNIAADVREIFVVVGAWYTGPIGGLLAGAISALYSPIGQPALHISTWVAHAMAGLALGLAYSTKTDRLSGINFVLTWARAVLTYYLVLLVTLGLCFSLLAPSFLKMVAGPEGTLLQGWLTLVSSALPEMGFVFLITVIGFMALPKKYRKPIWNVDKPTNT